VELLQRDLGGRYSDEDLVPSVVIAGWGRTIAWKGLRQAFGTGDSAYLKPAPARQFSAAVATYLISQQLDKAIVDTVVVRFDNAFLVLVSEAYQVFTPDSLRSSGSR
jgi:hypothetical protein